METGSSCFFYDRLVNPACVFPWDTGHRAGITGDYGYLNTLSLNDLIYGQRKVSFG